MPPLARVIGRPFRGCVNQLQVVSENQFLCGPVVLRVVPPTLVTFVLSAGGSTGFFRDEYSPLSPDAWKNDCPWRRTPRKPVRFPRR